MCAAYKEGKMNTAILNKKLNILSSRHPQPTVRDALVNAYRDFEKKYPEWMASLFDRHYVETRILPMLQAHSEGRINIHAFLLAYEWSNQLHLEPETRSELVLEMIPAAADFLKAVDLELTKKSQVTNH